jgi:hypothetical protein
MLLLLTQKMAIRAQAGTENEQAFLCFATQTVCKVRLAEGNADRALYPLLF